MKRRFSRAHWVAVVLALLAGLVVHAALRESWTIRVAVADRAIGSARPVTAEMVSWVEVPAGSAFVDGLGDETTLLGSEWIAARSIYPGEPLTEHVGRTLLAPVGGAIGAGRRT